MIVWQGAIILMIVLFSGGLKIINLHNFSPSPAICIAMTGTRNCTSQSFFDDLGKRNENKIIQHNLEVEI